MLNIIYKYIEPLYDNNTQSQGLEYIKVNIHKYRASRDSP